jgi:hypothetical protein
MTVLRLTRKASLSKTWLNAGKSEYLTLLHWSDKVMSADNQQERPETKKSDLKCVFWVSTLKIWFIFGLVGSVVGIGLGLGLGLLHRLLR